jgi:hypothetical protein
VSGLQERLDEAGAAWTALQTAEAQLERLAKYQRKTRDMRADEQHYRDVVLRSKGTLSRVLGKQR